MNFLNPVTFSGVSPFVESIQNSWNMNLASLVAVSRDVRQKAEYVSTSNVNNTLYVPGIASSTMCAIPPPKIAVAP